MGSSAEEYLSHLRHQRDEAVKRRRSLLQRAEAERASEVLLDAKILDLERWLSRSAGTATLFDHLEDPPAMIALAPDHFEHLRELGVDCRGGKPIRWQVARAACTSLGKPVATLREIALEMERIAPGFDVRPGFLSRDFEAHKKHWVRVGLGVYQCKWIIKEGDDVAQKEQG